MMAVRRCTSVSRSWLSCASRSAIRVCLTATIALITAATTPPANPIQAAATGYPPAAARRSPTLLIRDAMVLTFSCPFIEKTRLDSPYEQLF